MKKIKKISIILLTIFTIIVSFKINAYANSGDMVYLGGENIGIKLTTGVTVIGKYEVETEHGKIKPWKDSNIEVNDVIVAMNNLKITDNNSLLNVLSNIKEFSNNKLSVVIGCGGNRDVTKRSEIAEIAVKYADRVIFTSDNPRDEDPDKIINDMISKLDRKNYQVIIDRKEAILNALNHSLKDEVIAILGKGSERDQLINGIKSPFSDKEVVYGWIKSKE